MKEKSRWFYAGNVEQTKAVILIAHGLNLNPAKMDQLSQFFTEHDCDVLRIVLGPDPKHWEEKFNEDYDKAREQADILQRPLYFVGYSLGALIGLHFISKHPDHVFKKAALFAPATQTKTFTKLSAILAMIFPKGRLPSLNLREYRERDYTTLAEYKKMNELQKDIEGVHFLVPTIVFAIAHDELIHYGRLAKFASQNQNWKLVTISDTTTPLPKKYHHLMIDDLSLGQSEWKKILKNLTDHFLL